MMNGVLRELRNGGEGIGREDCIVLSIEACIWVAYETEVQFRASCVYLCPRLGCQVRTVASFRYRFLSAGQSGITFV